MHGGVNLFGSSRCGLLRERFCGGHGFQEGLGGEVLGEVDQEMVKSGFGCGGFSSWNWLMRNRVGLQMMVGTCPPPRPPHHAEAGTRVSG